MLVQSSLQLLKTEKHSSVVDSWQVCTIIARTTLHWQIIFRSWCYLWGCFGQILCRRNFSSTTPRTLPWPIEFLVISFNFSKMPRKSDLALAIMLGKWPLMGWWWLPRDGKMNGPGGFHFSFRYKLTASCRVAHIHHTLQVVPAAINVSLVLLCPESFVNLLPQMLIQVG